MSTDRGRGRARARRTTPTPHPPTITVHNRQRAVRVPLPWLRRIAQLALHHSRPHSVSPQSPLLSLPEIEVSIVSDKVIAGLHDRFMAISGPTDVITFEHGEIVISAQTAQRQAQEYGQPLDHELALYIIHGLLHLNGYDDHRPREAARMRRLQERILRTCLIGVSAV